MVCRGIAVKEHQSCGHDHDHDHDHDHSHDHDHGNVAFPPDDPGETEIYAGSGVQFRYPRSWEMQEESSPDQTTFTIQSAGTTYWTLSLFDERPSPEQVVTSVMKAYEDLYEDLDIYEPDVQVMGIPAIAREIDFVCLDLVSTAGLIVFQTERRTVLITYQGEDRELETTRPLVDSITQSLVCDVV